jgi:hypothetical protein
MRSRFLLGVTSSRSWNPRAATPPNEAIADRFGQHCRRGRVGLDRRPEPANGRSLGQLLREPGEAGVSHRPVPRCKTGFYGQML